MAWINVISYDDAEGKVKTLYDRVKGPDNNVDNIMMMHSLRPHSMEAHICTSSCVPPSSAGATNASS